LFRKCTEKLIQLVQNPQIMRLVGVRLKLKVKLEKSKNKYRISNNRNRLKNIFYITRGTIMGLQLINIGFGNVVSENRVISIVAPESAPIKRIITVARDSNKLVDATYGRRTRAVIITDSDHVVLSAVQPETVGQRVLTHDEYGDE